MMMQEIKESWNGFLGHQNVHPCSDVPNGFSVEVVEARMDFKDGEETEPAVSQLHALHPIEGRVTPYPLVLHAVHSKNKSLS